VYDVAARYPQRFAAMAVLSGGGEPATAERLKTVPAWIFHGADDDQILPRYSAAIADAMKKEGAEVKLTILPGVGHGGWDKIYADPELYAWFLQHARGAAVR
jgi:predicted peptidase